MPGSVSSAAPVTVMPWSLCRSFAHSREYQVQENGYPNGESQRGLITSTSRKTWRTERRLTVAVLAAFKAFFLARNAGQEPFYIYDPWETSPKFSYDAAGVETTGRYTVRFNCTWQQMTEIPRSNVGIAVIEIA